MSRSPTHDADDRTRPGSEDTGRLPRASSTGAAPRPDELPDKSVGHRRCSTSSIGLNTPTRSNTSQEVSPSHPAPLAKGKTSSDTANDIARRLCPMSYIDPTTPTKSRYIEEISSPPPPPLAKGNNTSSETSNRFPPTPRDVRENPTTLSGSEGQQATSQIGGTAATPICGGKSTRLPPFGGRTPTRNSHHSGMKCFISYIGSKRSSTSSERRGTSSHFGGTVSKTTTTTNLNNCERSTSGQKKRSTSHFGGTVPKNTKTGTTTANLNNGEISRSHFSGQTVPRNTNTAKSLSHFERPTSRENKRSTTRLGGDGPRKSTATTTLNICENKRSTGYPGTARRPLSTTTVLDGSCERKCSVAYLGRPDVVLGVSPSCGSQRATPGESNRVNVHRGESASSRARSTTTVLDGSCERMRSLTYLGRPATNQTATAAESDGGSVYRGASAANGGTTETPKDDAVDVDDADDLHASPSCRICHDDTTSEPLMSPCRCKGTIGHVHHTCLARWLGQDLTRSFTCELCRYRYPVVEARRYTLLESIPVWVRDPLNKERFCSFLCVSGFITMINLVVYVTATVVMRYTALSSAPDWFVVCMFLFLVLLYLWNLVQCFKDTIFDHWYWWWTNCVDVCLDIDQIVAATKLKESSEDDLEGSGSCASLRSCHEACAIDLSAVWF